MDITQSQKSNGRLIMEGLKKITQEIGEEAEEEAQEILKEAEEEAQEIREEGEEQAETERNRIITRGEREAERIKRRIVANARRKARQSKLQAREEVIQEVLEESKEKLSKLSDNKEEYKSILRDLIVDGGIAVGGGNLKVQVLEEDKDLISSEELEEISGEISDNTGNDTNLNLEASLKNAEGGAIVEKVDGSISSDNTFEARLERRKESLRSEVAKILFGN